MNSVINLSNYQVFSAYLFVILVLSLVKFKGFGHGKTEVIACIRMTLQLILTGFLLQYIIKNPNPFATISIIVLMESFAIHIVYGKFKGEISKSFKRIIAISLPTGTVISILFFMLAVIRIKPWYMPQYFIPIAGMIVGNSMTGISLAINSLNKAMTARKQEVEEALILGATPKDASISILKSAFDAAIMPTINTMMGMGIIFLPGMMTGQILSGTSPITAITYQIIIMLGILSAAVLSVVMILFFGYRTFFNHQAQLNNS